jgi:hypothetical protein
MADEKNDNKVISKNNSGFPDYLDFDKLRSGGIDYLGKLSGKIWTDHNVHDPGITILEILCYAMLDLGYRTNLPVKDIFARDPEDKSKDDNFLTPSQILTCNPLTITDFRKLLIDIDGVKNAWLEVATDVDIEKFCPPDQPTTPPVDPPILLSVVNPSGQTEKECCINYLNGLYHVYLELEDSKEEEIKDAEKKKDFLKKIKGALLSHRNICEDFIDIKILCKWQTGVCADIELEAGADPEKIYLEMAEKLRDFFSPSPRFYTLPQLLDKGKTIDEIFAGRPYGITESHGFVDAEEFEKLKLRKTIHVSDVYNVLFSVPGIRKVNRLRLRNCDSKSNREDQWEIRIPKGHVPDFSIACSGFQFTRQGMPLAFDFKKYEGLLKINFVHNGKILYRLPSLNLDTEIPAGVYRNDLDTYYSVQNEFPRVYGIAEGGLSDTASPLRIAQALQLKGYLLFFDQLLANYLTQLKNLRSLFSLSLPDKKENRPTYFINQPGFVPDLQKLVKSKVNADSTGSDGSLLAFPVSREWLTEKIESKEVNCLSIESVKPYSFSTGIERDIAVKQLQEDMFGEQFSCSYITKNDDCVFYYVVTSSPDYVLISSRYYKNEQEAQTAFGSLKYAAATASSYHSFNVSGGHAFSFDISSGFSTYTGYLQLLAEDETLNQQRRQSFLQHLLSRFAEQFTDFALFSFGHYSSDELDKKDIRAKEFFLHNYAQLSSNRGKALDYSANGWNSDNISGLEKRFKAVTGSENLKRQSLCNFEVYEYSKKFIFTLNLAGRIVFNSDKKFESEAEAAQAAKKLFESLENRVNYQVKELTAKKGHAIHISYGEKKEAILSGDYSSEKVAAETADRLQKMFSASEVNGKEEIASYKYSSHLNNYTGQVVRTFAETYNNETDARSNAVKSINKINDNKTWKKPDKEKLDIGKLIYNASSPEHPLFIDLDKFAVDFDRTTIGKPGIVTYEVLDKDQHRFKFRSLNEFENEKLAREDVQRLLLLLAAIENYNVQQDKESGRWAIFITEGEKQQAFSVFNSENEALRMKEEIHQIVTQYSYHLRVDAVPDTWKFNYNLGYETESTYTVKSQKAYASKEEATRALKLFDEGIASAVPEKKGKELFIKSGKEKNIAITAKVETVTSSDENSLNKVMDRVTAILETKKDIRRLHAVVNKEQSFAAYVDPDKENECPFVYHLVDKDAVMAVYTGGLQAVTGVTRKEVIKKNVSEYNFPELCLRGDVTVERAGEDGKTKWYHYQIKTVNTISKPGGGIAEKLVLFESTHGYTTKEEAEKAFAENHLAVFKLGLIEENYGEKKAISLTVIGVHSDDPCIKSESIVFVPAETLAYLGIYPGGPMKELIIIVKGYPIRSITKKEDCDEFYNRFLPCAERDCEKIKDECTAGKEKPLYFFVLYDKINDKEEWQSRLYYETQQAAMEAFRFFLLLLKYEGNYYIDCNCTGKSKIYIREVLAESTDHFKTAAAAWGENGIQKFINTAQTPESFYPYVDDDCCNKFFVGCKNIRAVHPCKYDTPEIRDKALEQLYKSALDLSGWSFNGFCKEWKESFVDFNGQTIASVTLAGNNILRPGATYLENYIDIISYINSYCLCIDEEKKEVYLEIDNDRSIHFGFIHNAETNTLKELKEKLLWIACYFPFTKKEMEKSTVRNEHFTWCIEIRLPGFNSCGKGCTEEYDDERCSVAWISECCYNSCEEAIAAYEIIISWIKNRELYKQVFDCVCGSYGITLHDKQRECIEFNNQTGSTRTAVTNKSLELSRIIAVNPQCYPSAEIVCDAIERAKRLINSEGLQLVEHILLRPQCIEDCDCRILPCELRTDTRNKLDDCKFEWKDFDDDDPCNKDEKPVCFVPGHDPYSFIATIALPAWPQRFRKKESRDLIENILYREAPAHVALRVLWLTPHDLCCFEKHLKKWLTWMAYQKSCEANYTTCDFINFLFRQEFECLADPVVCDTCIPVTTDLSCIDAIKKEEDDKQKQNNECHQDWFQQFSALYCWKEFNCDKNYFVSCEERQIRIPAQPTSVTILSATAYSPVPEVNTIPAEPVAQPKTIIDKSSKAKFVNGRLTSYRKNADELIPVSKKKNEKELIEKARSFLKASKVSVKEYQQLVADLLKLTEINKDAKTGLGKKQVHELIGNLTYFFLDKNCFNGKNQEELNECSETFAAMRKSRMDLAKLYLGWGPVSVKKYEPELNIKRIEKLFTG